MYTHLIGKMIGPDGVETVYIDIPKATTRTVPSRDSLLHVIAADIDDFTGQPYKVSADHPQAYLIHQLARLLWRSGIARGEVAEISDEIRSDMGLDGEALGTVESFEAELLRRF